MVRDAGAACRDSIIQWNYVLGLPDPDDPPTHARPCSLISVDLVIARPRMCLRIIRIGQSQNVVPLMIESRHAAPGIPNHLQAGTYSRLRSSRKQAIWLG